MSIEYTYEVVATNEQARCMEVRYSSPGREPVLVGTRLPFLGESLEAVVAEYAPVRYWADLEKPIELPEVGTTGVATGSLLTDKPQEEAQTGEFITNMTAM